MGLHDGWNKDTFGCELNVADNQISAQTNQ